MIKYVDVNDFGLYGKACQCLPKVVNPGSILARLKRVFTTSSLFMYNCRHRSIKFWTWRKVFAKIIKPDIRNRFVELPFGDQHKKKKKKKSISRKQIMSYKFNIFTRNFPAIIA